MITALKIDFDAIVVFYDERHGSCCCAGQGHIGRGHGEVEVSAEVVQALKGQLIYVFRHEAV